MVTYHIWLKYCLIAVLLNTGESNNSHVTGVFSEDFSIMCEREGLIKIPMVVNNPKLQCGASLDDHSSLGSRMYVTLEDDDPNSLKHVQFRNLRMTAKLASILVDTSRDSTASIQGLSLWNNGAPFSDTTTASLLTDWMHSHEIQHLSIGANTIPVSVFDDLIGVKSPLLLVHDKCMSNL